MSTLEIKLTEEQRERLTEGLEGEEIGSRYMIRSVINRGYVPSLEQYANRFQLTGNVVSESYLAVKRDAQRVLSEHGITEPTPPQQ